MGKSLDDSMREVVTIINGIAETYHQNPAKVLKSGWDAFVINYIIHDFGTSIEEKLTETDNEGNPLYSLDELIQNDDIVKMPDSEKINELKAGFDALQDRAKKGGWI